MDASKDDLIVGQNINVKIEQILPDLILVTFQHPNNKLFQGILLDATKRGFPCGVYSTRNEKDSPENDPLKNESSKDPFYSVKQRHTYQSLENQSKSNYKLSNRQNILNPRSKNSRKPMTVRLRPRQVLCSNCQSICNEKSEKIGPLKSTKSIITNNMSDSNYNINRNLYNPNARETRSVRESRRSIFASKNNSAVLVPKLRKLKDSDIAYATNIGVKCGDNDEGSGSSDYYIETEDIKNKDKLLTLKLSSISPPELMLRKRKGKVSKMTISNTNSIINGDRKRDCKIRTRSRGSVEERANKSVHSELYVKEQSDGKVILSSNITHENDSTVNNVGNGDEVADNNNLTTDKIYEVEELSQENTNIAKPIQEVTENFEEKSEKMNLRKKRSVGSMEDLWDETIFEEMKKVKDEEEVSDVYIEDSEMSASCEKPKTTPILKILFGPGKGTVLKIPARSTVTDINTSEVEESVQSDKKEKLLISKATRKALKRARKEAQRKGIPLLNTKAKFEGRSPIRIMSPARLGGFSTGRFGNASPRRFGNSSPGRFGNASPGRFGNSSPGRFSNASPGRFGGSSPGRFGGASPARFPGSSPLGIMQSARISKETFLNTQTKRHKHKVKHKKKHKEERRHKSSDENAEPNNFSTKDSLCKEEAEPLSETTTNVNNECCEKNIEIDEWKSPTSPEHLLHGPTSPKPSSFNSTRQKLSISIKRVNNASYVACDHSSEHSEDCEGNLAASNMETNELEEKIPFSVDAIENNEENKNIVYNVMNVSPQREDGSEHSHSSDESWDIPDLSYLESEAYVNFKAGDVVWGKIDELPWWPAKVICLKNFEDNQQAQVNWYGTSETSVLPIKTLQPFLKCFNMIFNRRKRGPYLEAVQQASCDAQQNIENTEQTINICESPITASPREVDVMS